MIKVLFLCHGNICRSPMAEFVFKDMVKKKGLEEKFYIASAATSSEKIYCGVGNPVYPPARRMLEKHGISCDGKQAVRLQKEDYEKYDMLICMDSNNVKNTLRITGADPMEKISKLGDFSGRGDLADPWYTDDFDKTYDDIYAGCSRLLDHLSQEENLKL